MLVNEESLLYVEVTKGMYGIHQAGILAQQQQEQRLNQHGYYQSDIIPGFWTYESRPILFTLVVDDFGVKYVGKVQVDHLMSILKQHHELESNWTGAKYIGLIIEWYNLHKKILISMPKYANKALERIASDSSQTTKCTPPIHATPIWSKGAICQNTGQCTTSWGKIHPMPEGRSNKFSCNQCFSHRTS